MYNYKAMASGGRTKQRERGSGKSITVICRRDCYYCFMRRASVINKRLMTVTRWQEEGKGELRKIAERTDRFCAAWVDIGKNVTRKIDLRSFLHFGVVGCE